MHICQKYFIALRWHPGKVSICCQMPNLDYFLLFYFGNAEPIMQYVSLYGLFAYQLRKFFKAFWLTHQKHGIFPSQCRNKHSSKKPCGACNENFTHGALMRAVYKKFFINQFGK